MSEKNSLLILDDESASVNTIARMFRQEYTVHKFTKPVDALKFLESEPVDMILADQRMPEMTGVEFFMKSRSLVPDAVRILITGYTDLEAVITAINSGQIYYYISKPWEPDVLRSIVANGMEKINLLRSNHQLLHQLKVMNERLNEENTLLKKQVEQEYTFDFIIGNSAAMKKVLNMTRKIIPTDVTVLIQGETGTGKELLARAIHYNSPRKNKLFVAENCGAVPESLLESRLFGHRKGAFTGAVKDQKGIFELAQGGTVFLDEIGDTTLSFQQRLLRVLQEREMRPLGAEFTLPVDVRIIAATNKNLQEMVQTGSFREDLYHRLNVIPLKLPPLRERGEDIRLLAEFFVKKYSGILGNTVAGLSDDALARLKKYEFKGNIRELENLIQRAVALTERGKPITPDKIFLDELAESVAIDVPPGGVAGLNIKQEVARVEVRIIRQAIRDCNGNISRAAAVMGLSRMGLYKKIRRYNLTEFL